MSVVLSRRCVWTLNGRNNAETVAGSQNRLKRPGRPVLGAFRRPFQMRRCLSHGESSKCIFLTIGIILFVGKRSMTDTEGCCAEKVAVLCQTGQHVKPSLLLPSAVMKYGQLKPTPLRVVPLSKLLNVSMYASTIKGCCQFYSK